MKAAHPAGATIAVGTALCAAPATPTPAHAAVMLISAGDRIDLGSDFCTLGYPFTAAHHSYAIIAGHRQTSPGQRGRDQASNATGGFVRALVDPPHTGGADYSLIDFGPHARVLPLVVGNLTLEPEADNPPPAQDKPSAAAASPPEPSAAQFLPATAPSNTSPST